MYVCMSVCVYVCVCVCLCVYVCVYVCVFVYIYIYIHLFSHMYIFMRILYKHKNTTNIHVRRHQTILSHVSNTWPSSRILDSTKHVGCKMFSSQEGFLSLSFRH